jgi:Flp pilus assembly pilin Flp
MVDQVGVVLLYVRARLAELRPGEEGVTAVEYALMVAVVALLLVVGFFFLFRNISSKFSTTGSCVGAAPNNGAPC